MNRSHKFTALPCLDSPQRAAARRAERDISRNIAAALGCIGYTGWGVAGTVAGAAAQAAEPAPWPGAAADGGESALEHGFRPQSAARWPPLPRAHCDRSVESRECVSRARFFAQRRERCGDPRSGCSASPVAQGDHGRSRHRIHVAGTGRLRGGVACSSTSFGPGSPSRMAFASRSTAGFATNA